VGLVLAAGLSRRMGRAKLLLPLRGRPVVRWSVQAMVEAGLSRVVVVVGHERPAIEQALAGLPVDVVVNPDPEAGQGCSIAVGVAALPVDAEAVLIGLGDQPWVPREVVAGLRAALEWPGALVAAPVYREGRGNPVAFRRALFAELLALTGDRGARAVVERDPSRLALVSFDRPMPADVDTREDYEAMAADERARPRGGASPAPEAGGVN
jgi:molybdenum cofactor cytidylyltransferase